MHQVRRLLIAVGFSWILGLLPSIAGAQIQPADAARLLEGRDIFYDEHGLIVHKGTDGKFDGGDTAQREGWYWLGVWIRQNTPGLEPWKPERKLNFDQV